MARRGNAEARALLRGPEFPPHFRYLFDLFAELLLWCDGRPTWREIQPWSAMMGHSLSSWELRALRHIADVYFAPKAE